MISPVNVGDLFTLKLARLGAKNRRLTLSVDFYKIYIYYIFIPYNLFTHELRSGIKFVFYVKNDPKLDLISELVMSITLYWIRETELPNINKSCFSEISIKDIIESFFKHGNEYLEK